MGLPYGSLADRNVKQVPHSVLSLNFEAALLKNSRLKTFLYCVTDLKINRIPQIMH